MHHLIVITGASRGFGASLASSYLTESGASAVSFVLVGRDRTRLETVLAGLESVGPTLLKKVSVRGITVDSVDLSNMDELDKNIERIVDAIKQLRNKAAQENQPITKSILVNNAGSLGDLTKTAKEFSWQDARKYLDFNVVSMIGLSSTAFVKDTLAAHPKSSGEHETVVVSISSLLAVQAFAYWGLYATGKAARDMFLGVMGLEEADSNVKTLNYAPGPLDNEMQADVRATLGDKVQLEIYSNMHKEGRLVPMADSSKKLVNTLRVNDFKSGTHIDFYD
ncbi:hypothetical protein DFQ27_002241 [Actinomortierella ambigua]|uniref:Sepiapterin reductase n=1 Tax=Actinomortierella ambigua TaxID=1343610 RepID=A0A9P6QC28_9FUNG|nr:hypothetical protein DFQ27_002241 [Actinomortierella ambigua]